MDWDLEIALATMFALDKNILPVPKGGIKRSRDGPLNDKFDNECKGRPFQPGEIENLALQWSKQRKHQHHEMDVSSLVESIEEVDDTSFSLYEAMVETYKEIVKESDESRNMYMRASLSTDLLRDSRRNAGDQRLDAIRTTLNSLGYTRSQFQRVSTSKVIVHYDVRGEMLVVLCVYVCAICFYCVFFVQMFHDAFTKACLPIIYDKDWEYCSERVMKDLGITRIRAEVLIQTPRRFGKTVSVGMYVLALLINVPGIRICIFSTGKRAVSRNNYRVG